MNVGVMENLALDEMGVEWMPAPARKGPSFILRRISASNVGNGADWTPMEICNADASNGLTNLSRADLNCAYQIRAHQIANQTTDNRTEQA